MYEVHCVPLVRHKPKRLATTCMMTWILMRNGRIVWAHERFLELPVAVVLVVLWLAGIGLAGFCALALYLCWISLRAVVGA